MTEVLTLNYLEASLAKFKLLRISNNGNQLSIRLTIFLEVRLAKMETTTKRGFTSYLKYFPIQKT
jgi:hypothetical protein